MNHITQKFCLVKFTLGTNSSQSKYANYTPSFVNVICFKVLSNKSYHLQVQLPFDLYLISQKFNIFWLAVIVSHCTAVSRFIKVYIKWIQICNLQTNFYHLFYLSWFLDIFKTMYCDLAAKIHCCENFLKVKHFLRFLSGILSVKDTFHQICWVILSTKHFLTYRFP